MIIHRAGVYPEKGEEKEKGEVICPPHCFSISPHAFFSSSLLLLSSPCPDYQDGEMVDPAKRTESVDPQLERQVHINIKITISNINFSRILLTVKVTTSLILIHDRWRLSGTWWTAT